MIIGNVQISGTCARTVYCNTIPRGIIGAKVALEYDEELWSGLTKKAVFTNGLRTVELANPGDLVSLPPEVVDTAGKDVRIGVCGTDADGKLVIPTLWAVLSVVRNAVPVEADEAAEPTPPIWAQLMGMIGNLDDLDTDARKNLVAAVNELVARGGEIDAAEVQRIVEEYLAANMPEVKLPEALPNPHPLRLTGAVEATYDGSEAVEVVIPQGGGGVAKKWVHIAQIDMAEDANKIYITEDVNGNPFEVENIYAFVKTIKRTDELSAFRITKILYGGDGYINDNTSMALGPLVQRNSFGDKTRDFYCYYFESVVVGNYRKQKCVEQIGDISNAMTPAAPNVYNDGITIGTIKNNATVDGIMLLATNGFKVGDTIDIWGI